MLTFYRLVEGGRLSRPKHYSKGMQPLSKVVYHSGCHDKHNYLVFFCTDTTRLTIIFNFQV